MTDYKTMRVPEEAWETAKEVKEERGLTWAEYLRLPVEDHSTSVENDVENQQLAKAVATEIEKTDREDFDDWFSPDVAQTIAQHVINDMEYEVDVDTIVDELKDELSMAADPTVQPDVESLVKKVENLEAAVKEATQAAQSAEKSVEDLAQ